MLQRNLFISLLASRPREGMTPRKNFLTESFAYVLAADERLALDWFSKATRVQRAKLVRVVNIRTQELVQHPITGLHGFVDLTIEAEDIQGRTVKLLSEHKWDSVPDSGQIEFYRSVLAHNSFPGRVLFIGRPGRSLGQIASMLPSAEIMSWQDVADFLRKFGATDRIVHEFVNFLEDHVVAGVKSTPTSPAARRTHNTPLRQQLADYTNYLATSDWSFVPFRDRRDIAAYPNGRWGRVGIELNGDVWTPGIVVGFLISGRDHKLAMLSPDGEADLMLTVDDDKCRMQRNPELLKRRAEALCQVAPSVLWAGELRHDHRCLVVRQRLSEVVETGVNDGQRKELVYQRLVTWLRELMAIGEFEAACWATYPELGQPS
jgi:hypothetical protein